MANLELEKSGLMARKVMIERDLVKRGIRDPRVLKAFERVPRHIFVEPSLRFQAYEDHPLPIGAQQTISQPYMVALMTESLALNSECKALDIGTGSGYQAAILSCICKFVYSVERIPALVSRAKQRLDELQYHNVSVKLGDGWEGWTEYAPYDGIVVAAWASTVPNSLLQQLKVGGRMVIPIGDEKSQKLMLITRNADGFSEKSLGPCAFVPFVSDVQK